LRLKENRMKVEVYLNFDGRCEEAIDFYVRAVGAKVQMLMRYSDSPEPPPPGMMPAGTGHKVMHCSFTIGETTVMASDGYCKGEATYKGFSLSIAAADGAEAKQVFDALAEGGRIDMPLGKTFWSPSFGMLVDRFGVCWMVNAMAE
jgi:PhnB protein